LLEFKARFRLIFLGIEKWEEIYQPIHNTLKSSAWVSRILKVNYFNMTSK